LLSEKLKLLNMTTKSTFIAANSFNASVAEFQ